MHSSEHAHVAAVKADLVEWRRDRARQAGASPVQAGAVAANPRFDLHAMLVLIDRGCPADLAIRILAPLEED